MTINTAGWWVGFLSLCVASASASPAKARISGVEKPQQTLKIPRKDVESSDPSRTSFQRCLVYPSLVVVELDSGQIGADSISLRKRSPGTPVAELCAAHASAGEVTLASQEQYFQGMAGDYVVTTSADGAGAEGGLWVYDPSNGKPLHEAAYDLNRDFEFQAKGKLLSLTYFRRLKLSCLLAHEADKCWTKVKAENDIAPTLALPVPDCSRVLKSKNFMKYAELKISPDAFQIFAPVRVENVATPGEAKIVYLAGKPDCAAAP